MKNNKKKSKKAIIIAAGKGVRLRPFTQNLPKGLLPVGGDTIIGKQIKIYKKLKFDEINIIVGYKKEKFKFKNINYIFNKNFNKNNVLESLFSAKKILNQNCIISYSDIIYEEKIVKKLLNSNAPISIVVDTDWIKAYKGRIHHPVSEADKALFDKNKTLKNVGKNIPLTKTNSEFIGMLKLNSTGCKWFKDFYKIAKNKYQNQKFYTSLNIEKAYLTDFFKFLMRNKIPIKCTTIRSGWMEIDTAEDLVKAQKFYK